MTAHAAQRDRRRDPYPWTWEPPTAVTAVLVVLVVLGVHVGRFLANLLAGAGPTWPAAANDGATPGLVSAAFWTSAPSVAFGDAGAGLAQPPGTELAGVALTRGSVAVVETLAVAVVVTCTVAALNRWGPNRLRGMANAADVPGLLGTLRLARNAHVLRPDVVETHGKRRAGRRHRELGWRLGVAREPRAGELWVPWDRTAGVIGPQGSGKTLDILVPALLDAPGAALVTLTKPEDLLLSLTERAADDRPCVVLDPFGLADGVPSDLLSELVWDPVDGCVDAGVAERRAKAFTAGTVSGAITSGAGDDAARFYAMEASKVLQSYLHAAALAGLTIDDVLRWVANPKAAVDPEEILRRHSMAEPFWHGLLRASIRGDERTAANTVATVQQSMALFFQASVRRRCVPSPDRPVTSIRDVIERHGTIYLLGREDPYCSAAPLMTAVAEHVLDTALALAHESPWGGRLCPPFLACLDELPSTAPLPTLRTRMANERALGLSFIWAAQTRGQLSALFGEQESRALLGLTNVLVVFGGSKDVAFNQEVSDLLGTTRVGRRTRHVGRQGGGSVSGDDIAVLRPEEIRGILERQALVIAENAKPIIAGLSRVLDGKLGSARLAAQSELRACLADKQVRGADGGRDAALAESRRLGFAGETKAHG